jgi:hypothetical protein
MAPHHTPTTKELSPEEKKEKQFDRLWLACAIGCVVGWYLFSVKPIKFQKVYVPWIVFIGGSVLGLVPVYWIRRYVFSMDVTPRTFFSDFVANAKNIFLSIMVFGFLANRGFHKFIEVRVAGKPEIIAKLPVERISLNMGGRASRNGIDFLLDGNPQSFNNFYVTKEIRQAAEQGLKGYLLLHYQRGPWTSYVINDWDFVLDTSNR